MPIKQYGLVVGKVTAAREERDDTQSPHYQMKVVTGADGNFRVPVNVQSSDGSMVRYFVDEHFDHPMIEALAKLQAGHHAVPSQPGGLALDYVRGGLFDPAAMVALPSTEDGDDNDLHDLLDHLVGPVMSDPGGVVYAWGERWTNQSYRLPIDKEFEALSGVHDIHMNQGNPEKPKRFYESNGAWQDGGLVLRSPRAKTWKAIFLAFKSQSFNTDANGNPTRDADVVYDREESGVYITAAMVNPGPDGPESVSVLNGTDAPVSVAGWAIVDKEGNRDKLRGSIGAGAMRTFKLSGEGARLSNRGGVIALVDAGDHVVHAVRYSRNDAKRRGHSVVF